MMKPRFFLFGILLMQFAYNAYGMQCQLPFGMEMSCPTFVHSKEESFCCHNSENVPYCCDLAEYIKNNSTILVAILVGGVIVLILVTLCCCCCCSCCLLAKRRTNRGTVYASVPSPVVPHVYSPPPVYSTSSHPEPTTMVHAPPPSYPTTQPPLNPNFKG